MPIKQPFKLATDRVLPIVAQSDYVFGTNTEEQTLIWPLPSYSVPVHYHTCPAGNDAHDNPYDQSLFALPGANTGLPAPIPEAITSQVAKNNWIYSYTMDIGNAAMSGANSYYGQICTEFFQDGYGYLPWKVDPVELLNDAQTGGEDAAQTDVCISLIGGHFTATVVPDPLITCRVYIAPPKYSTVYGSMCRDAAQDAYDESAATIPLFHELHRARYFPDSTVNSMVGGFTPAADDSNVEYPGAEYLCSGCITYKNLKSFCRPVIVSGASPRTFEWDFHTLDNTWQPFEGRNLQNDTYSMRTEGSGAVFVDSSANIGCYHPFSLFSQGQGFIIIEAGSGSVQTQVSITCKYLVKVGEKAMILTMNSASFRKANDDNVPRINPYGFPGTGVFSGATRQEARVQRTATLTRQAFPKAKQEDVKKLAQGYAGVEAAVPPNTTQTADTSDVKSTVSCKPISDIIITNNNQPPTSDGGGLASVLGGGAPPTGPAAIGEEAGPGPGGLLGDLGGGMPVGA